MKFYCGRIGKAALSLVLLAANAALAQTEAEPLPPVEVQPETHQPATLEPAEEADAVAQAPRSSQADAAPASGAMQAKTRESSPARAVWQERLQQHEQRLRRLMVATGVTETAIQDAIIQYIQQDVQARHPVREMGRELYKSLRSPEVGEAELAELLAEFHAVLDQDKARREAAQAALDARIGYANKPRLEAMLLLFGLIGDAPAVIAFNVPPPAQTAPPPTAVVVAPDPAPAGPPAPPRLSQGGPLGGPIEPHPNVVLTREQYAALLKRFDWDHNNLLEEREYTAAMDFVAGVFSFPGVTTAVAKQAPRQPDQASSDEKDNKTNQ